MRRRSACFSLVAAFVLLVTNAAFAAMSDWDFFHLCGSGAPADIRAALEEGANADISVKEYGWSAWMNAARYNSHPK